MGSRSAVRRRTRTEFTNGAQPFGDGMVAAYARHWSDYGRGMQTVFERARKRWDIRCQSLADLACGEGSFLTALIGEDMRLFGVDVSPAMLMAAREREQERVGTLLTADPVSRIAPIEWLQQDIRELRLPMAVDVATSWYNSVNYLTGDGDLAATFRAVADALVPGGWFLFDMYTVRGLATDWRDGTWIAVDRPESFVVSRTEFDRRERLARVEFTGFLQRGDRFCRFDESHRNRAYPWASVKRLLGDAGLDPVGRFTVPRLEEAGREAIRIVVAAKKRGGE